MIGNGMVCMASQGNGDEQKGGAKQRNGEASQRKATALNRAHLTERQWNGNEPLISDEQWHGRSKRRKLGDGNSKHSMDGKEILRRNKFMFSHLMDAADGDQVVFVRSAEGHSHILNNKSRYKVGDEVAIAGILKVSAIQPNRDGTVSYSFDRGFALHENMVEQMLLRPHEKPIIEEVVPKPAYSGKVVAISVSPEAFSISLATNRVGRIFEISDGLLVGDRDDLYEKYGFVCEYDSPVHSFGEFCNCHAMNDWLELKS